MTGIVGIMRVKNEARWISESVRSISGLCDRVIVLDDGSTDGTPDIIRGIPKVSIFHGSPGREPDEARDKNLLIERARRFDPEWILCIDGDEVLCNPASVLEAIASGAAPAYTLRVAFLWDSPEQVRVDGVYRNLTRPSLFKLSAADGVFRETSFGQNFHCGSVPPDLRGKSMPCEAVLKHYGYMHKQDRLKKFEWYNRMDPDNALEDRYQHMVIGDLLPPETVTRHGGPLELQHWP